MKILRTQTNHPKVKQLVAELDQELRIMYGDEQDNYVASNDVSAGFPAVLLEKDGEGIGIGAFKEYDKTSVELKRIFVHPNYRGQGCSKKIVIALEEWIKELSYLTILLETGPKQAAAHALYKGLGYEITPNFGFYIEMGERSICMKKEM